MKKQPELAYYYNRETSQCINNRPDDFSEERDTEELFCKYYCVLQIRGLQVKRKVYSEDEYVNIHQPIKSISWYLKEGCEFVVLSSSTSARYSDNYFN